MDKTPPPEGIDKLALARAEYVQSNISLRALAKKHSIGLRTLARASKEGGWVEARMRYSNKVEALSDEKAAEWQAEYLAKGRKLAAANAMLLMEQINKLISSSKRARTVQDKEAAQLELTKQMMMLNAKEIAELSKACGLAFKALCDAAGVSPVDEGAATVDLPDDPAAEMEAAAVERPARKQPMELVDASG